MDLVGIWTDLIKCYRIALNIRADRYLYGHLINSGKVIKFFRVRSHFLTITRYIIHPILV